jgi:alkanesulfonate monooxygenase SsuD/methylene tetrahydromethanopterin reductase-like flavin-dependent oxidoreductase (luciferase family)
MKVGATLFCQNYTDWERHQSGDFQTPPRIADSEVYREDLRIGDLAEPLGFDALWSVEHHFTPYTMVPDVLQLLTYFAARTSRIDVGTMVVVLPWHDPVRVAEQVSMLDIMLAGRKIHVGFGRGAGRVEFNGFRTDMAETRDRFIECLEIVRGLLTNQRFGYEGKYYQIPEMSVRPQPLSTDLADRMYCAWQSPETLDIAARAGLGMLFIPQKPWEDYGADVEVFNDIRSGLGLKPLQPKVVCWVYCTESQSEGWEGALQYMSEYADSARRHYEFDDAAHFKAAGSYDYYAKLSEQMATLDEATRQQAFAGTQVWGTPEQCIEKLELIQRTTSASEFIGVFKYGAMPLEKAEKNMRLFAEKVLPKVQQFETSPLAAV